MAGMRCSSEPYLELIDDDGSVQGQQFASLCHDARVADASALPLCMAELSVGIALGVSGSAYPSDHSLVND